MPDARQSSEIGANVLSPTTMRGGALSFPADALQDVEGKPTVFVRIAPSQFSVRQVEIGSPGDGRIEIVRGLKEGEPVVTKGAFAVKSVLLGKELKEEKE